MTGHRLVLVRHAVAEREGDLGDALRPLTSDGRRQAAALGAALASRALVPDLAVVSSALRASETHRLLATGLPVAPPVLPDADVYGAGPRGVLDLLRAVPEEVGTVLVVAHEPTMSTLASLLADGGDLAAQVALGMPTAAAAVLDVRGRWADLDRGGAALVDLVRTPG